MWGIIQRPTNFDPQRKYPVIEYIYSGPEMLTRPKASFPYNGYTTALAGWDSSSCSSTPWGHPIAEEV